MTLFDGKFSPETVVSGVRQAIADKADGIMLCVVDRAPIKAALQLADHAGIPVVNAQAFDCDQLGQDGPRLFDAQVTYQNPAEPDAPMTYDAFIQDVWAYSQGLGIIAGTKGKAKLINVVFTDFQAVVIGDKGLRRALKDHCPDCEIVETLEVVGGDIGAPLQQKVAQALVQHPEANAITTQSDASIENIAAGVREWPPG